jgi:hypothetical protein
MPTDLKGYRNNCQQNVPVLFPGRKTAVIDPDDFSDKYYQTQVIRQVFSGATIVMPTAVEVSKGIFRGGITEYGQYGCITSLSPERD